MRFARVIVLVVSCLGLLGTAVCASSTEATAPPPERAYRITSGDVVSIAVWGQDRFTQECQVNGSGTISYPLLGDVRAAGLTCPELQTALQERLGQYLKSPQVMVKVVQYGALGTSVFVLGEVKNPGVYPLGSDATLLQALAAAGGATSLASGQVTVARASTGEIRTVGLEQARPGLSPTPEAMLAPGDVVMVNRKAEADETRRYSVLGEVPKPGRYEIPSAGEVTVLEAMEKAGLLNQDRTGGPGTPGGAAASAADLGSAMLTRGEVVVPLNLAALLQGDTSQNLLLQAGDVLTVPKRACLTAYALGEVRTQGRQALPVAATVVDLLNASGGVTQSALLSKATILRLVAGQPKSLAVDLGALLSRAEARQNITLQDGDVLFVPAKGEQDRSLLSFLPILPYLLK